MLTRRPHADAARGLALGLCLSTASCAHDFSIFDPLPGGDSGSVTPISVDASSPPETSTAADASPPVDVAPPPPEAGPLPEGSTCGADCKVEALSCAGTCAQIEQSCAAACAQGDNACTQMCTSQETTCTSQCVTQCETCTSAAGCIDPAGCTKAAP